METVICGKCGQQFAIRHDPALREVDAARKQALWVTDELVWDHIQERSIVAPSGCPTVKGLTQHLTGVCSMSRQNDQKVELLSKTADYYRRSIANYVEFAKTERKPRTRKQLEARLQMILKEIDSLSPVV